MSIKKVIGFALLAIIIYAPAIMLYNTTGDAVAFLLPVAALLVVALVALAVTLITESETPNVD